jgi:preprotein translocase subunit SecD
MRTAALALACIALLGAACGGGGGDSREVTITLQADTSRLEPGLSSAAFVDATAGVLRLRAEQYGLDAPLITFVGDVVTITVKGIDSSTATQLFSRGGVLEFKQPKITPEGIVTCRTLSGEEFGVIPENVNPDPPSGELARCFSRDKLGTPVWEPATVPEGDLTAESVEPEGWELREDPPSLAATFTEPGAKVLETVTDSLTGYPLGIFLDGELISAPRIQRAITNGAAVISGFDLEQARIYAAVLNSGPLALSLSATTPAPT